MAADPNADPFTLGGWNNNPSKSNSKDTTSWYQGQGYQWTPSGWQRPTAAGPGQFGGGMPSWMPPMGAVTGDAESALGDYEKTSKEAIGAITTTAQNAANNAATEYTARARQSGGSTMGAGTARAEALIEGQNAAFKQREQAASQAAQIASTIGDLRNNYLSTLSRSMGQSSAANAAASTKSGGSWEGILPSGEGASLGISPEAFNAGTGQVSSPLSGGNLTGSWSSGGFGGG